MRSNHFSKIILTTVTLILTFAVSLTALEAERIPLSALGPNADVCVASYQFSSDKEIKDATLNVTDYLGRPLDGWPKAVTTNLEMDKANPLRNNNDLYLRIDNRIIRWAVDGLSWGESYLFSLTHLDGSVETTRVTPFPVWGSDSKGHRIEMRLVTGQSWFYEVKMSGFKEGEPLELYSSSEEEFFTHEFKHSKNKVYTWSPATIGKNQGSAVYTIRGKDCLISLPIQWGKLQPVDQQGAEKYLSRSVKGFASH
ncbi:hypothetical protein SCG7086_AR_00220 [Chlamydiales bacterium SCGC AG-110-P3]|nr:hypothetical protein SCG7086_AR_00220 [Chlamydiales bacterium SCGC AG-110-P3]